jgi:hypothetical protein
MEVVVSELEADYACDIAGGGEAGGKELEEVTVVGGGGKMSRQLARKSKIWGKSIRVLEYI